MEYRHDDLSPCQRGPVNKISGSDLHCFAIKFTVRMLGVLFLQLFAYQVGELLLAEAR